MYGATCAYLTQDLAYTIFVFLMPEYVHQSRDSLNFTALAGKVLVMVIVYSLIYLFFAKKIVLNGEYPLNSTSSLGMMLGIIAAGKTLGSCARISYDVQQSFYFNIILLYDLLVTFAVLVLQMILRREEIYKMKIESEKSFREAQYRQYQLFRSNITSINHKCHDLKHMISALRAEKDVNNQEERLKELESSVMIYESQMNTGNKNLDAILTNTCMQCNQKNIQWTCMAEGQILDFMDALDMYIMLGNALDNAVENLETIADPECRFLVVNIWKKGALAFIKIENYCEKQVEFLNGIPQTTKEDVQEHGFGSRSIRDIVEKYHGELKISLSHNIFAVNIMMPANIT
nr:ATP-binding protein [uncultured Blautia sp.]